MSTKKLSAWIGCLVVLGMGLLAARAQAQELPPKTYMSKNVFYLPVRIEDRVRSNLREVQLFCKDNPNKAWALQEKASPGQTYFTFRAAHDGEYWFTVVIVDKAGRPTPADLRHEGPGLIVVLDTQLPQVDVQPLSSSPSEGTCVRCSVKDANADATKTHLYYQTGDLAWRPLDPMPEQPDQYCIPPQAAFTGLVKVEACDLAGNTINREFNLGISQAAAPTMAQTQDPVAPLKTIGFSSTPEKAHLVKTLPMTCDCPSNKAPAPFPADQVSGPDIEPAAGQPVKNVSGFLPMEARAPQGVKTDMDAEKFLAMKSGPGGTGQKPCSVAKHLVNKTHVFLQYQIDNTGPSGVGKVEFWLTRDKGQSWQKLSEDPRHKSPAEIDLPGEGLYGVSMVVSNGRGFGATPPAPGDAPDWWIEVDTTKPVAEIKALRNGIGQDSGCVFVTWAAQDKNLAAEPIDLYFAMSLNGPWTPMAQSLKNDCQFCWHIPPNLGSDAYVRLVVHDAAGNTTTTDCAQPVTLDDLSRPRGRLTGVTTTTETSAAQTVDIR